MKTLSCATVTLAAATLLAGCSVAPYKEPAPDRASATLNIALGSEMGETTLAYGRADEDGCLEFPPLFKSGSVRVPKTEQPAPKVVRIPADQGPQILRYYREIGRNAGARACTINLRLEPKKDVHYLITSKNRYESQKTPSWPFGEGTKTTEICMVYIFEMDQQEGLKPTAVQSVAINPTRIGVPGCPKADAPAPWRPF